MWRVRGAKACAVLWSFVALALAGCVDAGTPAAADEPPTEAVVDQDSGLGSILGTVVDDELNTIGGATIGLVQDGLETRSASNGSFVFNGLEPGTRNLVVQRLGFQSSGARVDVIAGQVSQVTLTLRAIRIVDAHFETQILQGFMTCHWSTPALKSRIACNEIGDEEETTLEFPVQPGLTVTLTETIWEKTTALGADQIELDHFFDGDAKESNIVSSSPHRHWSDDYDEFDKQKDILESYWLPFAPATQPVMFGFQQKFDVYMTAFYAMEGPSDDWSAAG